MKIGIITYQDTNNFGAILQCYALQRALTEVDIDSEVIDYRNSLVSSDNRNKQNIIKKLISKPLLYMKKNKFKEFIKQNIKLSKPFEDKEAMKNCKYDYYIIGSDQVWNYEINGGDLTYCMDFVEDKKKIRTYACSVGNASMPETLKVKYGEELKKIENILVREESTCDFIKKITNKDAIVTPDPVFLLSKEHWKKFSLNNIEKKDYIVSYFVGKNVQEKVEFLWKKFFKGEKLIKISGGLSIKDFINSNIRVRFNISPIKFLNYIKNATYIYTDSFHATAFCLIFNKPFNVFLSGNEGKDSRIINLLNRYGLEERMVYPNEDIKNISKVNTNDNISITKKINEEANYNLNKYTLRGILQ